MLLYNLQMLVSALCVQMFGHRCGFLIGVHDEFLDALEIISVESSRLQNTVSPAVAKRYNLPVWSRLANANTIALEKARDLVEQELSIAQDRISTGLVESTAIVDNLIISKDLNHETIVRHIIDLLMAAADTTAHTLAWCLYLIGQHKDAQQKARKELLAATGNEVANLSASSLAAVPYIKGMLKEGIRMYPVATFILRALSQETVLGRYHTPAGTVVSLSVYSTGRDSRFFSDAENFIPERWLRHQSSAALTCPKQSTGKHHSHAFLPFGIGARSCIGRRLAETQLQVFLAQLLATCQVSTLQPTHMKMRMVSIPADPIQIAIQQYND
ncbi:unnamed protein product [Meganyctiphanes norvegica]|uniref:Cytochrome P450 n=1 Tax=Meganyctiphanes norvegica TaxID=48144 RepID=A0AAV2QGJ7_MEGNR